MATRPQWSLVYDGVIQWGSFGSANAGPGPGTGNTRRRRWQVIDAGFEGVIVWNSFGTAGAAPQPQPDGLSGGGASGRKKYRRRAVNYDNLDLSKWRKRAQRLEARVEAVQKRIQAKRELLYDTQDYEAVEKLRKQVADLHAILLALLGELDMARKVYDEAEMADALAAYMAYRRLH